MKILGLILVIFYAALMLFALWKKGSRNASATGDALPNDGTSPAGSAPPTGGVLPNDGVSSTGSSPAMEPASSGRRLFLAEYLPSICIGAGSLLLLTYALLHMVQNRSLMPLLILGMFCISAGTLLNGIRQKKVHLLHHILRLIIEAAIVAICWMGISGSPKDMLSLETAIIDGTQAVLWDGRTYVPFCVVPKSDCGEQIGCLNGDADDRISAYKDYPFEQWLVSWLPMDGGAILLKEVTVDEIRDGLEDEYHIEVPLK